MMEGDEDSGALNAFKKKKNKKAHCKTFLDLVPISKKIQNLKGVVSAQSRLLH